MQNLYNLILYYDNMNFLTVIEIMKNKCKNFAFIFIEEI